LGLDTNAGEVEIDVIQVEQVVLNLLRNALEAMDERSPGPHSILLQTAATPDGGVEVRVRDDGPGLPVDDVEKLFEPFFTTKEKSLGMGLSISQRIVEAQGGALRAAANREGGATFAFTLPPAHTSRGCGSRCGLARAATPRLERARLFGAAAPPDPAGGTDAPTARSHPGSPGRSRPGGRRRPARGGPTLAAGPSPAPPGATPRATAPPPMPRH